MNHLELTDEQLWALREIQKISRTLFPAGPEAARAAAVLNKMQLGEPKPKTRELIIVVDGLEVESMPDDQARESAARIKEEFPDSEVRLRRAGPARVTINGPRKPAEGAGEPSYFWLSCPECGWEKTAATIRELSPSHVCEVRL